MKGLAFLSLLGVALLGGCTKQQVADPLCDVAVRSLTGAAQGIGEALKCANVPAIAVALTKPVKELALCSETQAQGLVGDLVCPQVAKFVLGLGLNALPPEWQCTGGDLGDSAQKVVFDTCKKAVNF